MKPVKPTPAPAYAAMLPSLQEIAHAHGYALGIHGSLNRDLDLMAMPWIEGAKPAAELIEALRVAVNGIVHKNGTPAGRWNGTEFVHAVIENPSHKPHGRMAWNIHLECGLFIDISVMPRAIDLADGALAFLKRTTEHRIVSSGDLTTLQIAEAQARGLFYVEPGGGFGWALVPWDLTTPKDRAREKEYFGQ